MNQAKTTVAALLVLATGLLLVVFLWGEGVESVPASGEAMELSSTANDVMPAELGDESTINAEADREQLTVVDADLPPWRLRRTS